VFPALSQQTILLLADGRRDEAQEPADIRFRRVRFRVEGAEGGVLVRDSGSKPLKPGQTLHRVLASEAVTNLESSLLKRLDVKRIGEVAKVDLGYVTGENKFFHLSAAEAESLGLSPAHLTRALTTEKGIAGLRFTARDWTQCLKDGRQAWLLTPKNRSARAVARLLRRKAAVGAQQRYKCKQRTPWWRVPLADPAPAFIVYMGNKMRIITNTAQVQISNTFYRVTEIGGMSPRDLAAASLTSVFRLSAVLNSRLLGGGLKKLEPSDVRRVMVPVSRIRAAAFDRIDRLVRSGQWGKARRLADELVLKRGLGWSTRMISRLQKAASSLDKLL